MASSSSTRSRPAKDEVDFRLVAHNPTDKASLAHWAQPCIRVDKFTGTTNADARELVPGLRPQVLSLHRRQADAPADRALGRQGPLHSRPGLLPQRTSIATT